MYYYGSYQPELRQQAAALATLLADEALQTRTSGDDLIRLS